MKREISEIKRRIKYNTCPSCEHSGISMELEISAVEMSKYRTACRKTFGHAGYQANINAFMVTYEFRKGVSEKGKKILNRLKELYPR